MYFLFSQPGLTGTMMWLILAHNVLATPILLISEAASHQGGGDMTLLKAAAMAGASPTRALVGIAVPMIAPGIVFGTLLSS